MDNVINMFEEREKKVTETEEESFDFSDIIKKNKEKEARVKADRLKDNNSVKRNYRLNNNKKR